MAPNRGRNRRWGARRAAPLVLLSFAVAVLAVAAHGVSGQAAGARGAQAAGVHKCASVKQVRGFKVKKIRISRPFPCSDAQKVTRKWVKKRYSGNGIRRKGRIWFCTWLRKDPGSRTTGTAECNSGATDEIRFTVRRR